MRRKLIIIHAAALALTLVLTVAIASTPEPAFFSVDRLEDGYAVLASVDGQCFSVPAAVFGLEIAEGQVLMVTVVPDLEARRQLEGANAAIVEGLASDVD